MRERIWPLLAFVVFLAILFYTAFQATLFYRLTSDWVEQENAIAMKAGGIGVLLRNVELRASLVNPDFNYSACAIDLRHGAYLVRGPDTSEYWSITVFNRHGEAMFNAGAGGSPGSFILYSEDSPTPSETGGIEAVEVPAPQGIAVFRLLANRAGRKPLNALQDELRCLPYRAALSNAAIVGP